MLNSQIKNESQRKTSKIKIVVNSELSLVKIWNIIHQKGIFAISRNIHELHQIYKWYSTNKSRIGISV